MLFQTLATAVATMTVGGLATFATVTGVTQDDPGGPDGGGPMPPCGAVWDRLPQELQDDLRALRDLPIGERRAAALAIRHHALAGDYGKRVQHFAEHRQKIRAHIWSRLPAEMRQDIMRARALPPELRPAAFQEIRDRALGGDYGERVQEVAERIQHRREVCGDPAA